MVNVPCIVCSEITDVTITCCNNSKKGMCKTCLASDFYYDPDASRISKVLGPL